MVVEAVAFALPDRAALADAFNARSAPLQEALCTNMAEQFPEAGW